MCDRPRRHLPCQGGSATIQQRKRPRRREIITVGLDLPKKVLQVSERRACRTIGQHRSTQRTVPCGAPDEERLTEDIIDLTRAHGRYGYRMITGLLNNAGWHVDHKRVERIWWRAGLTVPQNQAKKGRLWLGDRSCVRLRPVRPNDVWSHDFVLGRTHDGRIFRTLNNEPCPQSVRGRWRVTSDE